MGTWPGVASGLGAKLRRAQTLLNLQLWGCISCQDASHHVNVRVGLTQCCGFFFFGLFFPSAVDFAAFILCPLTAVLNPWP